MYFVEIGELKMSKIHLTKNVFWKISRIHSAKKMYFGEIENLKNTSRKKMYFRKIGKLKKYISKKVICRN